MKKSFALRRLEQELAKMTEEQLIAAILEGMEEGKMCTDDAEFKVICDTLLAIDEELERRKA